MIVRIWHGWTTPDNAEAYEALLKKEIFAGIAEKKITGYRGIELIRREAGDEVEFITMMRFSSIGDVKSFVGEDYERAYVPEAARKVLKRFDQRSQHYEVRETIDYVARAG
jgi:antibiotic biosynthesis monooxygenase (ABM) superfamily enzyme